MNRSILTLLPCALLFASPAPGQQRVEASRDLWISAYPTEVEGNNGGSPRLKLKGIQEFFLIDFDPAPLRGKKAIRAQLHVRLLSPEAPLRRITVSSIAQDWVEGTGTGYANVAGASSFVWAQTGISRWGGDERDITAVVCGEGGSIWGFGDATPPDADGWQIVSIAPEVAQARLDGLSHGFFVIDDVGSEYSRDGNAFEYAPFRNRYVSSREDRRDRRPYFTLWLETGAGRPAPETATHLPEQTRPEEAAVLPDAKPPVQASNPAIGEICRDLFGNPLDALQFHAAKGETIGFSVAGDSLAVSVKAPGLGVNRYAMPKVGGFHDPLIPEEMNVGDRAADRAFIDLHVPKDHPGGAVEGMIAVGGREMPFSLTVWNFTLPDRLSFLPQMNAYSLPGHLREYYRLAHRHRTVLNQLPYSWTGRLDEPAPRIGADGAWDWAEFDAVFGPLLDGGAFAGLPRDGAPVDAFYLPLNENWPMKHDEHFRGGYWIEDAFGEDYWKQFRAASAEIARHIEAKGWTEPMFEFYLNNKVYFKRDDWRKCSAAWIFDEPTNTQDFWALRRYGQEFWESVSPHPGARLVYRADISRPQWQRDLLEHCVTVEVVSGALRDWWPRVARRAKTSGKLYYMYGSASRIGSPAVDNAAWCVEAWSLGADGVVPWNTIGKETAWETPDDLSVMYPTPQGPVPSVRLTAFRAGQQLVEYLHQYCAVSGSSRERVMAAVREIPGFRATLEKSSEEDAGRSRFGPETAAAFDGLRLAIGQYLDSRGPVPRERWHDPRPPRPDLSRFRQIDPLPPPLAP